MLKFIAVAGLSLAFLTPSMAENLTVMLGTVRVFKSDAAFDTLIVGDPEIADVSVHSDQEFAVSAKKVGGTNIIALTKSKSVAGQYSIIVPSPTRTVIIYRIDRKEGVVPIYYDCQKDSGDCYPSKKEVRPIINTGPILTGEAIRAAQGRE